MYELPSNLLTANPINRYLVNSPMLPQLKRDADGGLTIYIQNATPGADKEANWLPAPKGAFACSMQARSIAGDVGFLTLTQCGDRPAR